MPKGLFEDRYSWRREQSHCGVIAKADKMKEVSIPNHDQKELKKQTKEEYHKMLHSIHERVQQTVLEYSYPQQSSHN